MGVSMVPNSDFNFKLFILENEISVVCRNAVITVLKRETSKYDKDYYFIRPSGHVIFS